MKFPSREIVERIRREYPAGTRVELVRMDDVQAPPAGTKGTVKGVDDTGSLLMRWDNGSEYKAERKILLKNLTGSSAFKNGGVGHEVSE